MDKYAIERRVGLDPLKGGLYTKLKNSVPISFPHVRVDPEFMTYAFNLMSGTVPPPFHPQMTIYESVAADNSQNTDVALDSESQHEGGHSQRQSQDDKSDPAASVPTSEATTVRQGSSAQGVPDQGGSDQESGKSTPPNDRPESRTSRKRKRDCSVEAEEDDTQGQRRCFGLGVSAQEHGEPEASHTQT